MFEVTPDISGKAGQCRGCKSTFAICVARPTGDEPALTLIDPVAPRYNFLSEGCVALARNAADLLRLAGEPVTPENVYKVVHSVPHRPADLSDLFWRDAFCNAALRKAYLRLVRDADRRRYGELADYFLHRVMGFDDDTLNLIDDAFAGALSVDFDRPKSTELAVIEKPRKRGPLERWAERMGW